MESISPSAPANGLVVQGNYIGTDSAGDNLGNQGNGVTVWSDDVTIGGTAAGAGNVIAYNRRAGMPLVFSVDHNSFLSNSIYDNADLGINLGDGPNTPNHPDEQGFTLPAPNDYQNYPVLTSAVTDGSSTEVIGTLNAAASTSYLVQFFASPTADPSGYGQGELYLGSTTVTTGSDYNANIDAMLSAAVPLGWVVSATATDPLGNTSEFSQDITAVTSADVGVQISASPSPAVYAGSTLTYTVTVSENGPRYCAGRDRDRYAAAEYRPERDGNHVGPGRDADDLQQHRDCRFRTHGCEHHGHADHHRRAHRRRGSPDHRPGRVTSQGTDPNPNNNTASLTTTVDPAADLALTLQGARHGQRRRYGHLHVDGDEQRALRRGRRGRERHSAAEHHVKRDGHHVDFGRDAGDRQRPGNGRPRYTGLGRDGHGDHHRPAQCRWRFPRSATAPPLPATHMTPTRTTTRHPR